MAKAATKAKKPARAKAEKKPQGRASSFDQAIADEICDRLVNGESLRAITRDETMPAPSTVFKWLATNESFAEQYARARDAQADTLADEILEIADDGRNDTYSVEIAEGVEVERVNHDVIARSKLRVDSRKWIAAKLKPKKYGEKLDVTSGGEKLPDLDPVARATRLASIFTDIEKRREAGEE